MYTSRLSRTTYPDNTFEENSYDANSNIRTLRKRDGITLTHNVDNTNKLTSTVVPSEQSIVFGYDSLGRETSVTRGAQTVTRTYEDLGRLETTTTNGKTLTYGYDSAGRRNQLTYPDGFYVTYGYETDSSLSNIKENGTKTLVSYSYNSLSRLTGIFRGNSVSSVLGHTSLNQLQNFDHLNINRASFQYSPAGQLISRITSSADYQIKIPQLGRQDYLPNNLNQYSTVAGQSLSYDLSGNLTNFDGWTYNYNAHNRLISATKTGNSLSLDYDASGRLNSSTLNGSKTSFLYDGNELVAEYNASGTLLKRYVHGVGSDDPLVSYDGAGTTSPTYLLADERGSIVAETNASGTVVQKHQYGPYGEPINQSSSRFRYTGQILLPGTELYHYKARVYHPKLGRFLQTDPIGYKDGMNWYAYVGNDPMNLVDPEGTCKEGVGTRICGGVSVNSSEYGFSSFGKTLSESPVGQAFEGGKDKFKEAAKGAGQAAVKAAVGAVKPVLKDGEAVKIEGCAAIYLGGCSSLAVTNDSVIFSNGLGRGFGASFSGGFVPLNADKVDGSVSWSTGMSFYAGSAGFELDFAKNSKPEVDLLIGPVGGFSINHTLMYHSVYRAEGR